MKEFTYEFENRHERLETYEWDNEETITAAEVQKAMADREVALATMKKNQDEWKAKNSAGQTAAPAKGGFNF